MNNTQQVDREIEEDLYQGELTDTEYLSLLEAILSRVEYVTEESIK